MRMLLAAALILNSLAPAFSGTTPVRASPEAFTPATADWWSVTYTSNQKTYTRYISLVNGRMKGIKGDGDFRYEFILYSADVKGTDPLVLTPTEMRLRHDDIHDLAKIVAKDTPKAKVEFSKFKSSLKPVSARVTASDSAAPVAAPLQRPVLQSATAALTPYEQSVLGVLKLEEGVPCKAQPVKIDECRAKLRGALTALKASLEKAPLTSFTPGEKIYLEGRLGQEQFIKFLGMAEKAPKQGNEKPFIKVYRERVKEEIAAYLQSPEAFDPAKVNSGVVAQFESDSGTGGTRAPATSLEAALHKLLLKTNAYATDHELGPERDLMSKFHEGKPAEAKIIALAKKESLSPQDLSEFQGYRAQAHAAAKSYLENPDPNHPLHKLGRDGVLNGYCNSQADVASLHKPKVSSTKEALERAQRKLEQQDRTASEIDEAAGVYAGADPEGTLSGDCARALNARIAQRTQNVGGLQGGRERGDSTFRAPPASGSYTTNQPPDKGADINANIHYYNAAKWAVVAAVAVGILTGGIGLAIAAAAGAAIIGYIVSKENNR